MLEISFPEEFGNIVFAKNPAFQSLIVQRSMLVIHLTLARAGGKDFVSLVIILWRLFSVNGADKDIA